MTKKDFTLIQDALNEAVKEIFKPGAMARKALDSTNISFLARQIENHVRAALANSFASRLPYTADDFDPTRFINHITTLRQGL